MQHYAPVAREATRSRLCRRLVALPELGSGPESRRRDLRQEITGGLKKIPGDSHIGVAQAELAGSA
ncbi:MAG: hypothetical protein ACRECE_11350, partial [Xanthobacteraceae bacterium]